MTPHNIKEVSARIDSDADYHRRTKFLNGIARTLFGRLLPKLPYPVLRGPLRGSRYILGATAGEAGGVSVHFGMQEVAQVRCLTTLLRPADVFFDVGANVGFYSLLASRLLRGGGKVAAFEPLPRNLSFLYRHLQLNSAGNVTISPVACADKLGTELFFPGENNALGRLANGGEAVASAAAPLLVATVPLDDAAKRLGVSPNIIKIDVEGAEFRVLKGARRTLSVARPTVLLSVHSDELRDQCLLYLKELRYDVEPLNAASIEAATEFVARPSSVPTGEAST